METATLNPIETTTVQPEVSTAVETLIAETATTPKAKVSKKAVKKVAPKAKKAVKKAAKPEVKKDETPAPKADNKIDLKALVIPKDAEMKIMGTCTKFIGKNGHGYLKGLTLEISNPIDSLKDRLELITKAQAEKYHLGKSKAFIRKIQGTADLQTILDLYFA